MRALSIRIDEKLGKELDEVCERTGYKKNTLVTRLLAAYIKHQGRGRGSKAKGKDPFEAVIGSLSLSSVVPSNEEIDRVVYSI